MTEMNLRKIVGVILWWAEGTKSRRDKRWKNAITYPLEITSTDPLAIKLFLNFIRKEILVDKARLKLQLQIHKNDDKEELESYWSEVTRIKRNNFEKTIIRPIGNKEGKTKGTCKIRYSDKKAYFLAKNILDTVLKSVSDS